MTDSIASRVGRIISGGLHQLLDAVEDAAPETIMEQAIREVESATEDVRAELGAVLANMHLASKRLSSAQAKHNDLSAKMQAALHDDREDLAEAAIAQQLDVEAQLPVLEATLKEGREKEKELEGFINALYAKKREMQEELRDFRQARAVAETPSATAAAGSGTVGRTGIESKVARAESAFDRVQERQTGLLGMAGDLRTAGHLAELADLARKNRIQERLAAAKATAKKV